MQELVHLWGRDTHPNTLRATPLSLRSFKTIIAKSAPAPDLKNILNMKKIFAFGTLKLPMALHPVRMADPAFIPSFRFFLHGTKSAQVVVAAAGEEIWFIELKALEALEMIWISGSVLLVAGRSVVAFIADPAAVFEPDHTFCAGWAFEEPD